MSPPKIQQQKAATAVAATHFAMALAMAAEIALTSQPHKVSTVAVLLLLQLDNLVVSFALGAVAWRLAGTRPGRALALAATTCVNLYLALDAAAFSMLGGHFRFSIGEAGFDLKLLKGSLASEAADNRLLQLNLLVWIAASVLLAWVLFRKEPRARQRRLAVATPPLRRRMLAGYALVTLVGFLAASGGGDVYRHPLLVLLTDVLRSRRAPTAGTLDRALFRGSQPPAGGLARGDGHAKDGGRARAGMPPGVLSASQPNLVLVVLESVGARELFAGRAAGGLFDGKKTPFLHSLEKHALAFNTVYTSYPATTRAHYALHTGGFMPTTGKLGAFLDCRSFEGPSLARALKTAGYETALFSAASLSAERLRDLFRQLGGYDTIYDFGEDDYREQQAHRASSWGGDERYVVGELKPWLRRRDGRRPFFLEFLTVSTHHPYSIEGSRSSEPARKRHQEALTHIDRALALLMGELAGELATPGSGQPRGRDTVVALVGDHGEAFGDVHRSNYLHKSALYDENVRGFLVLIHPKITDGPLVDGGVHSTADVLPTLAAAGLVTLSGEAVPGQNLLGPEAWPTAAYFHKTAHPESIGVRDGRYKFITALEGGSPLLFDLERDPDEQVNIAASHAELASAYNDRARRWYRAMSGTLAAKLSGCPPEIERLKSGR